MNKAIICLVLFVASFLLLNYKIDFGSLEPWDEAWYADIARNVTRGDVFVLKYNESTYVDHPPLGFWIEGAVFKLLGESDYTARLPSVIFSSLTIALIFLLGCKLGDKKTGLMAAAILFTCRWFLLRSRTGNLEPLLMFLQTLAVYLSWDSKRLRNLALAWFVLSLSLLTKTFVSLSLVPILIYNTAVFGKKRAYLLIALLAPVGLWYLLNTIAFDQWFIDHNIVTVAFRGGNMNGLTLTHINNTLLLLRSVVHRWYLPFFLSLIALGVLFLKNANSKKLLVFFGFMIAPYFISAKTMSWHLIPVTVPLALIIAYTCSRFPKPVYNVLFGAILIIAVISFKEYLPEAYGKSDKPSGQKIIGDHIKNLPGPVYLNAYHNLEPSVIYYADRLVVASKPPRPYTYITDKNDFNMENCKLITTVENVTVTQCQ